MIQFWQALVVDKKHLKSFVISTSLDSVLEVPDESHMRTVSASDLSRGQIDSTQQVISSIHIHVSQKITRKVFT